jgi:hypothetical protein
MLHCGNEDFVIPTGVLVQVRRFPCYRTGRERGVGTAGRRLNRKTLGGRTHDT